MSVTVVVVVVIVLAFVLVGVVFAGMIGDLVTLWRSIVATGEELGPVVRGISSEAEQAQAKMDAIQRKAAALRGDA